MWRSWKRWTERTEREGERGRRVGDMAGEDDGRRRGVEGEDGGDVEIDIIDRTGAVFDADGIDQHIS